MKITMQSQEHLSMAQKLYNQADYEGALQENEKVISLRGNVPPADEALFYAGLIYVHYGYPERNYQKSIDYFKRLVQVFPQSQYAEQAKIWINVLEENETMTRKIEELNNSIKTLQEENNTLNNQMEELDNSLKTLQEENDRLKKVIEALNNSIKRSNQVDIEIEEKKKELLK